MGKIIHCAAVFSDHCVLQRNKEIRVWGTASHGTKIEVTVNGHRAETVTQGHDWEVTFPSMEAGGPYVLEVVSEGVVYQRLEDVMIGEVWLAGGQSNMEYMLKQDADMLRHIALHCDKLKVVGHYSEEVLLEDGEIYV